MNYFGKEDEMSVTIYRVEVDGVDEPVAEVRWFRTAEAARRFAAEFADDGDGERADGLATISALSLPQHLSAEAVVAFLNGVCSTAEREMPMTDELQKIDELARADGWQDYPGDLDAPSAADWLCDCAGVPSDRLADVRERVLGVLTAYVTGAVDATKAGAELGQLLP